MERSSSGLIARHGAGWHQALLEKRLAVPVSIEDDANVAALAEATLGAGRDYRDVLVLMVGTGVGRD